MAAKRKTKGREAQLAFEALSIEGGLLSPEWLSKVAQLQAGTQGEADYRIHKGLNLRDELGRYWRIAQACWADFKSGRDAKADPKAVSERFVPALLRDAWGSPHLQPFPQSSLPNDCTPSTKRLSAGACLWSSHQPTAGSTLSPRRSATAAASVALSAWRRST